MMVGPLNIDGFDKASFKFTEVVSDIGNKVSVGAVFFAHDSVFVISEAFKVRIGGFQPQSAIGFISMA